jgi:hypothetical protein
MELLAHKFYVRMLMVYITTNVSDFFETVSTIFQRQMKVHGKMLLHRRYLHPTFIIFVFDSERHFDDN